MLLMLARQQAYSSYGGFAKLAFFFLFIFFKYFLAPRVGSPFLFICFFFGGLGAPRVVLDIPMGWGFKVGI